MKVASWGNYKQGNFGDDLMGGLIASFIKRHSEVLVLDLHEDEAKNYGVPSTANVKELVSGAELIVMGGGALLKKAQYLRAILRSAARNIEIAYFDLESSLRGDGTPLVPISIGSDDISSAGEISFLRKRVFSLPNCKRATVRLKSDVGFLKSYGVEADYFPDILFSTPHALGISPKPRTASVPKRIAINLHQRDVAVGTEAVNLLVKLYPEAEILFVDSHLSSSGISYEWMPATQNADRVIRYSGTRALVSLLQDVDLVLSSKLHVGLTAMSLGANFISVGGRGKVRAQLSELGLSDLAYLSVDRNSVERLSHLLDRYGDLASATAHVVPKVRQEAAGHFEFLAQFLEV